MPVLIYFSKKNNFIICVNKFNEILDYINHLNKKFVVKIT